MEYHTNKNFPKHFVFAKDLSGKYLFVCETLAELAGLDSPAQIIGRTDKDMFWKDWAECWREEDTQVYKGNTLLNHFGLAIYAQQPGIRQILTTKTALRDSQNNIIGVIGSTVDITEHQIIKNPGHFNTAEKNLY